MSTTAELCAECDEEMRFHQGEWVCPYCDSVSGFAMTPPENEKDSFSL
jgi:Zn finger protein HypA/HybF involved in hydrogenase expression